MINKNLTTLIFPIPYSLFPGNTEVSDYLREMVLGSKQFDVPNFANRLR